MSRGLGFSLWSSTRTRQVIFIDAEQDDEAPIYHATQSGDHIKIIDEANDHTYSTGVLH